MKTSLNITLFLLISLYCYGQEFTPSKEANDLKDVSSNTQVDYSTGIFHYSVPFYKISSGPISIPLSLDYTANGVRIDDKVSSSGFNWTLGGIGVITRTVRGGIPDEQRFGYAEPTYNYPELKDPGYYYDPVDEENDIFTASFNGKNIHFIIVKKNGERLPKVELLEKSNVKISYSLLTQDENGIEIYTWTIIDEDGVKYVFSEPEWTLEAVSEKDSKTVENKKFISAWYISEIVIPNHGNIIFYYSNSNSGKIINPVTHGGILHQYIHEVDYRYAYVHKKLALNYDSFMPRIRDLLDRVANRMQTIIDYNVYLNLVTRYDRDTWWSTVQTEVYMRDELIKVQRKILGQIIDMKDLGTAVSGIEDFLESATSNFPQDNEIKTLVQQINTQLYNMYSQVKDYTSEKTVLLNDRKISSPLLKEIKWKDEIIRLDYGNKFDQNYKLKYRYISKVSKIDFNQNLLQYFDLTVNDKGLLKRISKNASNKSLIEWYDFDYYFENEDLGKNCDLWGFSSSKTPNMANRKELTTLIDTNFNKKYTLKSINSNLGSKIELEYESNKINDGSIQLFGGIRIKKIITENINGKKESISYKYPNQGILIYPKVTNIDYPENLFGSSTILYDTVIKSRVEPKGSVILSYGNNGIYYPYVQECFENVGVNAYLYSVPISNGDLTAIYPHWLCGLLLGKASYDINGNLVYLYKNKYYADYQGYYLNVNSNEWFLVPHEKYFQSKIAIQDKHHKYHINYRKMYNYYASQGTIMLHSGSYLTPTVHYSPKEFFEYNFRWKENAPQLFGYIIRYGGKTLVQKQEEFLFTGNISTQPSIDHFTQSIPNSYLISSTQFSYDNPDLNNSPTRISKLLSNGDKIVELTRTPLDIQSGENQLIDQLRANNQLNLPVKKQKLLLKKGANKYKLLEEQVYEFSQYNNVVLPGKTYKSVINLNHKIDTTILKQDNRIYTLTSDKYKCETEIDYTNKDGLFHPEEIFTLNGNEVFRFNMFHCQPVLKSTNINSSELDFFDYYGYDMYSDNNPNSKLYREYIETIRKFLLVHDEYGEYFYIIDPYFGTESYSRVIRFSRAVMIPVEYRNLQSQYLDSISLDIMRLREAYKPIMPGYTNFEYYANNISRIAGLGAYEYQNYQMAVRYPNGLPMDNFLSVTPTNSTTKKYRITLYINPTQTSLALDYKVHRGSTTTSLRTPAKSLKQGVWQLVYYDIDISSYTGVTGITVDLPTLGTVANAIIGPENMQYEVNGFNSKGLVSHKFSHNGLGERYEYDNYWRLVCTYDLENNKLESKEYGDISVTPAITNNKVKSLKFLDKTSTNSNANFVTDIIYYDGFRRTLLEVQQGASPVNNADIILPHNYGAFGRIEQEYLPYYKLSNNGNYDPNYLSNENWTYLGASDKSYAYSKVEYDNSPLNREVFKMGPGANWHNLRKGLKIEYLFNAGNRVRNFEVNAGVLVSKDYYAANTLQLIKVTDEDGNITETYKDRAGREILIVNNVNSQTCETYMIYDEYGLVRYVLSPEFISTGINGNTINTTILQQLAYYYEYDNWGRNIIKRLPGCDPIHMVYDKKDRLVMSQDGNQRRTNKWSYTLYDSNNRIIETGEVVNGSTHQVLQSSANTSLNYIPTGTRTALQYTLYDNYTATTNVPVKSFTATSGYNSSFYNITTGLVTSLKTRILDTDQWITSTSYYDDRCRLIQTVSDNVLGGISRMDLTYNFIGNNLKTRESHTHGTITNIVETTNTYDNRGRLSSTRSTLNNGNPAIINLSYDAIGRLTSKTYGTGTYSFTETSSYNIRGWLTGRESNKFSMKLRYQDAQIATKRYNGNIAEWEWQHKVNSTDPRLMYTFSYDGLNRLNSATQYQFGTSWALASSNFNEKDITYDRNGNIKTLKRTANNLEVDNLVYTYVGNQLRTLTENVSGNPVGDIFEQKGITAGTYTYDSNGNMITDSRKGITLDYNVLNLVKEVKTGTAIKAKYTYLADGSKLRVRDASGTNGFDYIGSLTYAQKASGLSLEAANFVDFRIVVNGSTNKVEYNITDHLGSVRAIVDATNGRIIDQNDYYPFGARHVKSNYIVSSSSNRFKYNGKEEQTTGDLKYLDYGWRNYDNQLGRWFGMDPLSEKFPNASPFNYCGNNPLLFIDPDGMDKWSTNDPAEIEKFFNLMKNNQYGSLMELFSVGNWDHKHDWDFLMGLFYDDIANTLNYRDFLDIDGEQVLLDFSFDVDYKYRMPKEGIAIFNKEALRYQQMLANSPQAGKISQDYTLETFLIPMGKITKGKVLKKSPKIGKKLDYTFGKATGSAHNVERSRSMLRQLQSIGIFDNKSGRSLLENHLKEVFKTTQGIIQANGRYLRESLLMGPNGGLKVESIWDGSKLITIKLIGGR